MKTKTSINVVLVIWIFSISIPSFAQENSGEPQVSLGAPIRIGANFGVGLSPAFAGLDSTAGLGVHMDINLRVGLGRCGPILSYRNETLSYNGIRDHNTFVGAGAFCELAKMGSRGANFQVHVMYGYGGSQYTIDQDNGYNMKVAHTNGGAVLFGGDFFIPIAVGIGGNAGLNVEDAFFNYEYTKTGGTQTTTSHGTWSILPYIGFSYLFR